MSRADLLAWLGHRRPEPPAQLAARLERAIRDAPVEVTELALPEALLAVGRALVEEVAGRPHAGRAYALDLLAADAFITYAFEAQAELDLQGLRRLVEAATEEKR